MNFEALAWAIDCEGSIFLRKRKKPLDYAAGIKISMCDKQFPEKMKELFQCGTVHCLIRGENHRDLWTWIIQKQEDVEKLLSQCLHYFIIKRDKAEIVLAFLNFKKGLNHTNAKTGRFEPYPDYVWKTFESFYQRVRALTKDNRSVWGPVTE